MSKLSHYNIIVIGTGSGSKITRPAANLGFKVAVIDKGQLGGTCLNHGCIPSKMLIHPADIICEAAEGRQHSIRYDSPSIDFSTLVKRVSKTIDEESESIAPIYEKHDNIDLFRGHASFNSQKGVDIALNDGESISITGDVIFICTGAKPNIPPVKGLSKTPYWTYKEALRETKQPKSLAIIGGGYIAVELGHFYGTLGTKVDFLVRSEFLRPEDSDIKQAFNQAFSERFPTHFGVSIKEISYDNNMFTTTYTIDGDEDVHHLRTEKLLVATGVKPATDKLGLEHTNIKTDKQGHVIVDNCLKTHEDNIWAMGDVVGNYKFRHSANFEGEYLFDAVVQGTMIEKRPFIEPIDYPPMPHAVFTYPQVASIGVNENDCDPDSIVVGKNLYEDSAMGMALLPDVGMVKLVFSKQDRRLIGGHIIGKEAATMIHMVIAYMNMNATIDDMKRTIYIHPALPENIRNAVRRAYAGFLK